MTATCITSIPQKSTRHVTKSPHQYVGVYAKLRINFSLFGACCIGHSKNAMKKPPEGGFLLYENDNPYLHGAATADDAQQDDHDGDDQQDVDETADGVGTDQADQPQDNEYDCNGIEHGNFLSSTDWLFVQMLARRHPMTKACRCVFVQIPGQSMTDAQRNLYVIAHRQYKLLRDATRERSFANIAKSRTLGGGVAENDRHDK
jgi:hypothetical protein